MKDYLHAGCIRVMNMTRKGEVFLCPAPRCSCPINPGEVEGSVTCVYCSLPLTEEYLMEQARAEKETL